MLRSKLVNYKQLSPSPNTLGLLKSLARSNCQNKLEDVDYNKYGSKINEPFEPVGEHFIDTVIITAPIGSDTDVANKTNELRRYLLQFEISSLCSLVCLKAETHIFKWKLACSDVKAELLLQCLIRLSSLGFSSDEIDVTRDFAGSFCLNDIVEHFKVNFGLVEGYDKDNLGFFMERDMRQKTGFNCFVIKKGNIRFKIYLKFPQMICKNKVRQNLGLNWLNWLRPGSHYERLFSAHQTELAKERGMTRVEISIKNPSLVLKELIFEHNVFMDMLGKSLTWSSSHVLMWKAFADNLKHTLIVVDENFRGAGKHVGLAIVVYAFDSATRDICGFQVNNWQQNCSKIMSFFTFSSLLPIDLVKLSKMQGGDKNLNLELQGARYEKVLKKGASDVTCVTDSQGRFCVSQGHKEIDLVSCGFAEHPNVRLSLPTKRYGHNPEIPAHVVLTEEFEVKVVGEDDEGNFSNRFLEGKDLECIPLFDMSKRTKRDNDSEDDFLGSNLNPPISVRKLKDGFYEVQKIDKGNSSKQLYPILHVYVEDFICKVSMNAQLVEQYKQFSSAEIEQNKRLVVRKINKHNTCATLKLIE
jgi:hypothetical protein